MYSTALAVGGLLVSSCLAAPPPFKNTTGPVRNFIYIVPDGFGPSSQTLARDFSSLLQNGENIDAPVTFQLPADKLVLGSVRTLSSDSLITDSAAAATAFGCGVKTFNKAIAVDDDKQPVGSILEAAKLAGFKTGMVATSRITHATPACYASHVVNRKAEDKIAEQEVGMTHPLGLVADLMMGGGRCFFQPSSEKESCRDDDLDLIKFGKDQGINVFTDRAGFDALGGGAATALPFLGLFTRKHMSFEIDRDPAQEPSLVEMADTALNALKAATVNSDKGFFLMIEASRIDHAGHNNDPVGHLHDIIKFNEAIELVMKFIDNNPDTQMLSAADHECGGLTLKQKEYDPLVLKAANASAEFLSDQFEDFTGGDDEAFLRSTIIPAYGITDITDDEVEALLALKEDSDFANELGNILSGRGGINWSTDKHSAVDTTLFGYAQGSQLNELKASMGGNFDNTELPVFIEQKLGVSLQAATDKLRSGNTDFVSNGVDKRALDDEYNHVD